MAYYVMQSTVCGFHVITQHTFNTNSPEALLLLYEVLKIEQCLDNVEWCFVSALDQMLLGLLDHVTAAFMNEVARIRNLDSTS